jgi:prepilin-type N-terminal cleavage/methylation domain-containing protein
MKKTLVRRWFAGAHLDTTTRNFLPLPARNEWGEGRGERHSIKSASSLRPFPPFREEREKTSSGRVVVASRCARCAPRGFTLIELLVVIAIIGILAGLLLPVIGKAKVSAQVAKASTEITDLVAAISRYESDYSRYPASAKAREAAKGGDFTFGTLNLLPNGGSVSLVAKDGKTPLPTIANGYQYENSNAEVMSALMDTEKFRTTPSINTPNLNHALNPNKVGYVNVKEVSDIKLAGVGPDGVYRDPWGNPYIISVDLNGDNRCRDAFYRLDQVSQNVQGNNNGLNGLSRPATAVDTFEANKPVMVWSFGPDGKVNFKALTNARENKDNVRSW